MECQKSIKMLVFRPFFSKGVLIANKYHFVFIKPIKSTQLFVISIYFENVTLAIFSLLYHLNIRISKFYSAEDHSTVQMSDYFSLRPKRNYSVE